MTPATCRNCDAPLSGPYCAQCGQHARESARALAALAHDAWHVITHLDGRFWSTLRLLMLRPGELTLEYFAERRARYVPPVRLYLVISIAFFGLASLSSALGERTTIALRRVAPSAAELAEAKREAEQTAREAAAAGAPVTAGDAGVGVTFDVRDCSKVQSSWHWLDEPLRNACRRIASDGGAAIGHAFLANIPKMMFVFLPLVAAVMVPLYWFPRRYYVEHLVFFLHNHAALFLAMTLRMLIADAARLAPGLRTATAVATLAVACYAVWYVYRSMRRSYRQGRALTLTKLALVCGAYLVFLGVTLLGTFLVSALIA